MSTMYDWLEEHVLISDQCPLRRSPDCCLYHNDHIESDTVEKIAEYLGDKTPDSSNGFVTSSILGAACTCDQNEHSLPYGLLKPDRTNMPYDKWQQEEDKLILYFANVCNKLKDKEDAQDLWTFLHEILTHWYKWRDPSVKNILSVIMAVTSKPYKDAFVLEISPEFWKDVFTSSLQEQLRDHFCDVWLHTDENLALQNKICFVVHAPSFDHFARVKSCLQQKVQEIKDRDKSNSDSNDSGNEDLEDCEDEESVNFDHSESEQCNNESTSPVPSTSLENTEREEQSTQVVSADGSTSPKPSTSEEMTIPILEPSASTVPPQTEQTPTVSHSDVNGPTETIQVNCTIARSISNLGELLSSDIPQLQSPKSPEVAMTFEDVSRQFMFHMTGGSSLVT